LLLFAFFAVCFLIILRQAYKKIRKVSTLSSSWPVPSIGACLIPAISFDYKLSVLPASILLLIPVFRSFERDKNKFLFIILTVLFSIAYSSTLYSYVNKPEIFQYNLPALLVILTIVTILSCARSNGIGVLSDNAPEVNSDEP